MGRCFPLWHSVCPGTFLKYYTAYGKFSGLEQTSDGGYVLSSLKFIELNNQNYYSYLIKTDSAGEITWTKKIISNDRAPLTASTRDGGILFVYYGNERNYSNPKAYKILKYTNDGNLLWKKTINYDVAFLGGTSDSGFVVIGSGLYKYDKEGQLLWNTPSKNINSTGGIILGDGSILRTYRTRVEFYDNNGTMIWTKSLPIASLNYSAADDSSVVISGMNYITRISLDGSKQITRNTDTLYNVCSTVNGNYILLKKNRILWLSSQLDSFREKLLDLPFIPAMFKKVGKDLLAAGENIWFMKNNSEWNGAFLSIVSPVYDQNIKPDSSFEIKWLSEGVNSINLQYSVDNRKTWNSIAYTANTGKFNWTVPDIYADAFIRIISADNQNIFSTSGMIHIHNNQPEDYIAVNNIKMYVRNNGQGSHFSEWDSGGLFWPGGENATISAVFVDGLIWGGKVKGELRANGNNFRNGLVPGKILDNGEADNPLSYKYNMWKIIRHWETLPGGAKKEQLKNNYYNWPAEIGAPYEDINKDGEFTRNVDNPLIYGDETLWFTANDTDSMTTKFVYWTLPIGLEIQVTIYGFNRGDDLDDIVFKKYKIINKSASMIKDLYFGYWSDADLGFPFDDCVGGDSVLSLGYIFNGDNGDERYGIAPPAIGYKLVQGPVIEGSPEDSAFYDEKWIRGRKNLPMTSFSPNTKHGVFSDIAYSWEAYNLLQGRLWDGSDIIDPITNKVTKYPLCGDPVAGTGWYDGGGWPGGPDPYDRRLIVCSGPVNMAPSDTQEVVYAIIMARGSSNINSIAELKKKARLVKEFYNNQSLTDVHFTETPEPKYELAQSYPNPINPSTTIRYSLAEKSFVEMSVYDILGKKVMTLVNEERPTGEYQVRFNAHHLSSGVYYYQLRAGDYKEVKKMLLIK